MLFWTLCSNFIRISITESLCITEKVAFYLLSNRGFEYFYYYAVNPITIKFANKANNIANQKFIAFDEFEFEGQKPFKNFIFPDIGVKVKPGILAVLLRVPKKEKKYQPKL